MQNTNRKDHFGNITRVENIKCEEQVFPMFAQLLVGDNTERSIRYFDASFYLNQTHLKPYSVDDFLRNYFHPISAIVSAYELDRSRVCIRNTENHILIDCSLLYLFLCYTNPDFLAHINDRIDELFTRGFCVSDAYLYNTAKQRITPDLFLIDDDGTNSN